MKILFLGLILATASAFATTVTFDTNNTDTTFSCASYAGTGSCVFNAATPYMVRVDDLILTYAPNSGSVSAPPQTSIGAGDIIASCATGPTGCTAFADFTGVTFGLNITEATFGDAFFSAVLSGSASFSSSAIRVPLVPSSVMLTLGSTSVTFTPDQPVLGYTINPVSDNQPTTLQMLVDSSTRSNVPEPGSMALLASGLIGLGLLSRRKK